MSKQSRTRWNGWRRTSRIGETRHRSRGHVGRLDVYRHRRRGGELEGKAGFGVAGRYVVSQCSQRKERTVAARRRLVLAPPGASVMSKQSGVGVHRHRGSGASLRRRQREVGVPGRGRRGLSVTVRRHQGRVGQQWSGNAAEGGHGRRRIERHGTEGTSSQPWTRCAGSGTGRTFSQSTLGRDRRGKRWNRCARSTRLGGAAEDRNAGLGLENLGGAAAVGKLWSGTQVGSGRALGWQPRMGLAWRPKEWRGDGVVQPSTQRQASGAVTW